MWKPICHMFVVLTAAALLSGCALYPAVQVAGGAMTGYDAVVMADEYMPRDSVKGGGTCLNYDGQLQRRLRERLKLNGLDTVSAHVIDTQAYLVGQFPNRQGADRSIDVASSVQGISIINCKFFPLASPRQARDDTRLLAAVSQSLGSSSRLSEADLRVEVIGGHAVLVGTAADWEQKTAAVAITSEIGGIRDVIDYIVVRQQPAPPVDGEKVAAN